MASESFLAKVKYHEKKRAFRELSFSFLDGIFMLSLWQMYLMDKKSKLLFLAFFLFVAGAIALTCYKYIIVRDYVVEAETDCDPYTEKCFVYVCDPLAGEECIGNSVQDISYYKIIRRNAKNTPLCNPNTEGCDALICSENEADCSYVLCDPTMIKNGDICNDPDAYVSQNPTIEEDVYDKGIGVDGISRGTSDSEVNIPSED